MIDTTSRYRGMAALLAISALLALAISLVCLAGCAVGGQASGGASEASSQAARPSEVVGIIGAMDVEVESLKSAASVQGADTIAGMQFCRGSLGGKQVVIVKCGMGKVNAGICADTLINDYGCTKIINTGVAGSLDDRIEIGDFVISTDAVQHDFNAEPIGFAKGEIPYTGLYAFPADEGLRTAAVSALKKAAPEINVFEGRVCTGDQFIKTKEQRDQITSNFGGLCCEMEGGAIAQACYLNGTPFVIVRVISDKPNETGVADYKEFESLAAQRCAALVELMVGSLDT